MEVVFEKRGRRSVVYCNTIEEFKLNLILRYKIIFWIVLPNISIVEVFQRVIRVKGKKIDFNKTKRFSDIKS